MTGITPGQSVMLLCGLLCVVPLLGGVLGFVFVRGLAARRPVLHVEKFPATETTPARSEYRLVVEARQRIEVEE